MKQIVHSLLLLVAACSTSPPASSLPDENLAAIVDEVMLPHVAPDAAGDPARCVSAAVALVVDGKPWVRGYSAAADTPFQIGSVSKLLTGLVLARLVEAGTIDPDAQPAMYVAPDLRVSGLVGATYTLADLASHHSGLPVMPPNLVDRDWNGQPDPDTDPLSPGRGYARTDLVQYYSMASPTTPASYRYSNLGVGVLAIALADATGATDYHALVSTHVLEPLGMLETFGRVTAIPSDVLARAPMSYATVNDRRIPGKLAEMGVLAGAGETVTTADDATRLLAALTGTSGPLSDAIERAITPLAPHGMPGAEIGYAIDIEHLADGDRFGKTGGTASASAHVSFRREPAIGVMVMLACGGMEVRRLAIEIDERLVARGLQP
jgi:CubicO group peptidase (beta-lactamase class C family)